MPRFIAILCAACCFAVRGGFAHDPIPTTSVRPYERLLKGDEAKQAELLERNLEKAETAGDFSAAIEAAEKLVELRRRVQGADHWQAREQATEPERLRKLASLSESRRQRWYSALTGAGEAQKLESKARYREAMPLWETYEWECREIFGEEHVGVAGCYGNKAANLNAQAKHSEAQPLLRKALDIYRQTLGEQHPHTASSYTLLALNLNDQARYAEAQPLIQKALEIRRVSLGLDHPATARSYVNLAFNLNAQAKLAEANRLYLIALGILLESQGEEHPDTANCLSNLAMNLSAQSRHAEAEPLLQRSLEIKRMTLGEDHPATATGYNNLAFNLDAQERRAEAQVRFQKALDIYRTTLGDEHPDTASGYNNLASCLDSQEKHVQAQKLYEKALDLQLKVLGDRHPKTANSYNNLASCLYAQAKYSEAQLLYQKALELYRKTLGDEHPDTAACYTNLASCLMAQGNRAESLNLFLEAIPVFESVRLAGGTGLERSSVGQANPREATAALLAVDDPRAAWRQMEFSLARGFLDQQATVRLAPEEVAQQADLLSTAESARKQILRLASQRERSETEQQELTELARLLRQASVSLSELAARVSQREVAAMDAIQQSIPETGAIVLWADFADDPGRVQEHWGCVVRATGPPRWVRLPGMGAHQSWTKADADLASALRNSLATHASAKEIGAQSRALFVQRLEPLMPHLDGVQSLSVVAVNWMKGIPVELMAPQFIVNYVPSGTFMARLKDRPEPAGNRLLAIGDPIFGASVNLDKNDELPPEGLLVLQIVPGSPSDQARMLAGDVIVQYADVKISSSESLSKAIEANRNGTTVDVTIWREGHRETFVRTVPVGKLGMVVSKEPAREAIANRRKIKTLIASLRSGNWEELPGTRVELTQIANLFGSDRTTAILDSNASEQSLEAMRKRGDLLKHRYLHFATHGEANQGKAFESALILSQDKLPEHPLPLAGEPFLNGQLSAREVLEFWKLNAELVTLSACETAVGKSGGGDGPLGFAQAFLAAGSRSVCLSLWKVNDTATSLLMSRFYQNVLGKRAGLEKPMGKAASLHEAKQWLRELSTDEALQWTAGATSGVVRGDRGTIKELKLVVPRADPERPADTTAKPFAHPKYWAAFILIGDPN